MLGEVGIEKARTALHDVVSAHVDYVFSFKQPLDVQNHVAYMRVQVFKFKNSIDKAETRLVAMGIFEKIVDAGEKS